MKKKIISIVTILLVADSLFAVELDFSWDTGNIFVDGQLNFSKEVNGTLNAGAKIGSINFIDNDSGLALSYFPFVWNCENKFGPTISNNQFYFLNFELFYGLLDNEKINIGPYASVNYLDLINLSFSNYEADLGFKFAWYNNNYNSFFFRPELINCTAGVRVRNNKFSGFISAGFNFGGFIYGIINSKYESAVSYKDNF